MHQEGRDAKKHLCLPKKPGVAWLSQCWLKAWLKQCLSARSCRVVLRLQSSQFCLLAASFAFVAECSAVALPILVGALLSFDDVEWVQKSPGVVAARQLVDLGVGVCF